MRIYVIELIAWISFTN